MPWIDCPTCRGSGGGPDRALYCSPCRGRGRVYADPEEYHPDAYTEDTGNDDEPDLRDEDECDPEELSQ